MITYPPAPERFKLGDNRRFHWREQGPFMGLKTYEVYSIGLELWAECPTPELAILVADALEAIYENHSE